jgi:hypothetical protein
MRVVRLDPASVSVWWVAMGVVVVMDVRISGMPLLRFGEKEVGDVRGFVLLRSGRERVRRCAVVSRGEAGRSSFVPRLVVYEVQ